MWRWFNSIASSPSSRANSHKSGGDAFDDAPSYGSSVDIWSFGVMAWYLFTCTPPYAEYMGGSIIKLFLDLNGNGEMDTNFLGIPKEPFGFSNNAKGKLGPPSFDAAAFQVREATEIAIKL